MVGRRVGIEIGGSFTDVVFVPPGAGVRRLLGHPRNGAEVNSDTSLTALSRGAGARDPFAVELIKKRARSGRDGFNHLSQLA